MKLTPILRASVHRLLAPFCIGAVALMAVSDDPAQRHTFSAESSALLIRATDSSHHLLHIVLPAASVL